MANIYNIYKICSRASFIFVALGITVNTLANRIHIWTMREQNRVIGSTSYRSHTMHKPEGIHTEMRLTKVGTAYTAISIV